MEGGEKVNMQIAFTKAKIDLISGQDPKQFKVNKKPEGKSFGEVLYREKETEEKGQKKEMQERYRYERVRKRYRER